MEFGVITKEELRMTSHALDSTAVAVVLFDYGKFSPGGSVRHTRIKILKPGGLAYADAADIVSRNESMRKLKASTYNLVDGHMVETKLEKTSVFNEEFNEFVDIVKFALPQVQVGSVIEYKYEMIPQSGGNLYVLAQQWNFQRQIPTVYSEFIFEKTSSAEYNKTVTGYHPLTLFEDEPGSFRWVMSNVPALNLEANSPPQNNFKAQARVALTDASFARTHYVAFNTSWDRIGRLFLNANFMHGNIKNSRFLKDEAEKIAAGKTNDIDKVKAIYSYITKNLTWNERESILTNVTKASFDKRTLTSGEINLILLAMLRYAGVQADPVLISTRENGFIRKGFPEVSQFNRVIVQATIDNQAVLIDATDPILPFDYLPTQCLNGEGFLILGEDKMKWIEITSSAKQRSRLAISADLTVNPNGDVTGKVEFVRTGYEARASRKEYTVKGADKYQRELLAQNAAEVEGAIFKGMEDAAEPVKETYLVSLSGRAHVANDVIYLDPLLFAQPDQTMFTALDRTYPIDFVYPRETVWQLNFKLPAGYKLDETPAPRTAVVPGNGGRFMYSVVSKEQSITVISQYTLTRSSFTQEEYGALREFHKLMGAKHDEKIVLKKN